MPIRQSCTLDWNVRIANHAGYMGVASRCRHVDGTFFVDLGVQRKSDSDSRAFFFKCPSDQLVAMELISLEELSKSAPKGTIKTVGWGEIQRCESEREQREWLDDMGLHLYGYPVEYDQYVG
jgi:hypothetical protein